MDTVNFSEISTIQQQTNKLHPPFSHDSSLRSFDECVSLYPAFIMYGFETLRPKKHPTKFLSVELRTPRLDKIHKHLWIAGIPIPARPLYRQQHVGRNITITENPDHHLVWDDSRIFVKPLPQYLLSFDFWKNELCSDPVLYRDACGLLLSYSWLVSFQSDLRIAHKHNLLPETIDWTTWTTFIDNFLTHVETSPALHISERYQYGELRLSVLDYIYRINPGLFMLKNFTGGFMPGYMSHHSFIQSRFAELLVILVFLAVMLSAIQVGLATNQLANNSSFNKASYVLALVSLFLILLSTIAGAVIGIPRLMFHLIAMLRFRRSLSGDDENV